MRSGYTGMPFTEQSIERVGLSACATVAIGWMDLFEQTMNNTDIRFGEPTICPETKSNSEQIAKSVQERI